VIVRYFPGRVVTADEGRCTGERRWAGGVVRRRGKVDRQGESGGGELAEGVLKAEVAMPMNGEGCESDGRLWR
jgi:hypothetical protein